MNRAALGLALGAGYLLGRTRKLKMAMAVGSVVAGKKLNLTPRGVAQLVNQQLRDNPQFKEIGDQLRQDLQGVGKAASGALVERQMTALADRLHSRTERVRGQVSGSVPGTGSKNEQETGEDEEQETGEDAERGESREDSADRESGTGDRAGDADEGREDEQRGERPAKKAAQKKAPGRKDGERGAAARKTAAKKTAKKTGAARKTAAKQTAGAGSAARGGRSRPAKGGDDR
ncbi:DNA primase [Streptomyces sp. NBC_00557]|uniref:DNA primase n=1 Tax=Streptomyces sp. NBC_00557 TaxID=2975776 RepID=UPI002E813A73|nr:DNA primase [Streptomyces sp. NBC_00557]WUC33833.1 DNA primase [Streptomyces sp. NBC_00557]